MLIVRGDEAWDDVSYAGVLHHESPRFRSQSGIPGDQRHSGS